MPRKRLDLQTETLLEGRPHWTQEELDAYADYQALKEQEIEDAEEARMIAQGGFGRSSERGIGSLLRSINGQIDTKSVRYRFYL
jgi:hypothetical protein